MGSRRCGSLGGAPLGGRHPHWFHWAVLPAMAVGLVAASSLPATAQGQLPSERAALGLALAVLSMHQFAAQHPAPQRAAARHVVARNALPDQGGDPAGGMTKPGIQESQADAPSQPRATAPNGPNGPDDRNLGSGGPTGGTSASPPGAAQGSDRSNSDASSGRSGSGNSETGAGGNDDKGGADTGNGDRGEGDSDNPRSPTPN